MTDLPGGWFDPDDGPLLFLVFRQSRPACWISFRVFHERWLHQEWPPSPRARPLSRLGPRPISSQQQKQINKFWKSCTPSGDFCQLFDDSRPGGSALLLLVIKRSSVNNVTWSALISWFADWYKWMMMISKLTSVCSSRLVSVSSVVRVVTCGPLSSTTWPSSVTTTCRLTLVSICLVVTCSTLRFLIHSSVVVMPNRQRWGLNDSSAHSKSFKSFKLDLFYLVSLWRSYPHRPPVRNRIERNVITTIHHLVDQVAIRETRPFPLAPQLSKNWRWPLTKKISSPYIAISYFSLRPLISTPPTPKINQNIQLGLYTKVCRNTPGIRFSLHTILDR